MQARGNAIGHFSERYTLVHKRDALPRYAESLIETLCAHYREGA